MEALAELRAMVVDNDAELRVVAAHALSQLGFECLEAASGEEALAKAEDWDPQLVIADVEMPGLDGFATATLLRRKLGERVAILISTAHGDPSTIETAFQAGGSDFIEKPFDWPLLRHRVRFLMRAHSAFFELTQNQRRMALAQRLAKVGHWEWRPDRDELVCSDEARRILELPQGEALSMINLLATVHPEDRPKVRSGYETARLGETWRLDHRIGRRFPKVVRHLATPIVSPAGQIVGVSGTIQDITERERAAEQIRSLSYYDGLTGLPNRPMLEKHIETLCEEAADVHGEFALLRINVDRFNEVTAALPPSRKDELIREFASRIDLRLRGTGPQGKIEKSPFTIARVGNKQFAVVQRDAGDADSAVALARRLLQIVAEPFLVDGEALMLSISIGVALYPADGEEGAVLFQAADAAMVEAGHAVPNSFRMANPGQQSSSGRRIQIEMALNSGFDRGEIFPLFQPQWSATTGEVVGAEILTRWHNHKLGPVSPGEFVPVAEDTGFIVQLTDWTLERACQQLQAWRRSKIEPIRLSVNISPRFIEAVNVVERVGELIDRYGVDPCLLEFEFTETAMIANQERVEAVATELRSMGLRMALDDFGTGYSSLQHLVRFPLDSVKVDLSFVRRIEVDHAARTICSTLLAMSQQLGLETVAEGVETEGQQEFLRGHGADILQGFLVSPAVSIEDCLAIRDERRQGTGN